MGSRADNAITANGGIFVEVLEHESRLRLELNDLVDPPHYAVVFHTEGDSGVFENPDVRSCAMVTDLVIPPETTVVEVRFGIHVAPDRCGTSVAATTGSIRMSFW